MGLLLFGEGRRRQKERLLAAREVLAAKKKELEHTVGTPRLPALGFFIPVHEDAAARSRLEAEVAHIDALVRADQSVIQQY